MPGSAVLLLRVAATWTLPGLGLLALPEEASPHLMGYPLHTALAVEAVLPDGNRHHAIATVEEIARTATTERGLLLDFGPALVDQLPPGTKIWLIEDGAANIGLGQQVVAAKHGQFEYLD